VIHVKITKQVYKVFEREKWRQYHQDALASFTGKILSQKSRDRISFHVSDIAHHSNTIDRFLEVDGVEQAVNIIKQLHGDVPVWHWVRYLKMTREDAMVLQLSSNAVELIKE